MTRQLSRYPNDVKIAWALIVSVSPLLHCFNYRIRPISTNSNVKSSTFETSERDSELTRYRAFFFSSPSFFDTPTYYSRLSFSTSPNLQPRIISYYIAVLYIYICIYLLFCPGDRKIEGKTHRVVRPPDNLSLIRDDLAIIGGRISRYILFQSKFISASLHTRTHAAVYLIFFSLFLFFSPPSSSFYFDQKAIYFSTAFERAYDFLVFCDKR